MNPPVADGCRHPDSHQPRPGRRCAICHRQRVVEAVAALEQSLSVDQVAAALEAVAAHPAQLRTLTAALAAHPDALLVGAPPIVGLLVAELIARGSTTLAAPTCVACGTTQRPLTWTDAGGMCAPCAHRHNTRICAACGLLKPAAGRTRDGQPICERCRRHTRGHRRCGICGNTAAIAVCSRNGQPDVCVNCYRLPHAVCTACGRRRPCTFANSPNPICPSCTPRTGAICAHCGRLRPPSVRWPEGPVCDPCYTAALQRRGTCTGCGEIRRLVAPPGPEATVCADCAGRPDLAASHVCADCGIEDKLYERGRCSRCSLHRRAIQALTGPGGDVPAEFTAVLEAIVAAHNPRSALNWLRGGAGAAVLGELTAEGMPVSHDALDAHPRRQAADYLRQMLVAGGVLPERDEYLTRTGRWATDLLTSITDPTDRRLIAAFATWRVLLRLRRRAETHPHPRTYTRGARLQIAAAVRFLEWLHQQRISLEEVGQDDLDVWLTTTGPAAPDIHEFLTWATEHGHCHPLSVPTHRPHDGPATSQDQRWSLLDRLLHDDTLELTDRVAGALLLCYGQQLSRITAMTREQITQHDGAVFVRFGLDQITVPEPLAGLLTDLLTHRRDYAGIGSPTTTPWLFPGLLPGRPLTAARLGERLRSLGVYAQAGRRATLTQLAATLPAAVLADLLNIAPATAVHWVAQSGGDWSRYAAELARERVHQP